MITEIEVLDHPDQEFLIRLGNKDIRIKLLFNPSSNRWTMDIWINENLALCGRKIITGIDIIARYELEIGHIYAIDTRASPAQPERYSFTSGDVRLVHSDKEL